MGLSRALSHDLKKMLYDCHLYDINFILLSIRNSNHLTMMPHQKGNTYITDH